MNKKKKVLDLNGDEVIKAKFRVPEMYRVEPPMGLPNPVGSNNGYFMIPVGNKGNTTICAMASDGQGWDHVSLQVLEKGKFKMPSWDVMEFIKQLFWEPDACVVQYHPPADQYVNNDPNVLHLWRFHGPMPTPHYSMVGTAPGKTPPEFDPKVFEVPEKGQNDNGQS